MANYVFPFHNVSDDHFLIINNTSITDNDVIPLNNLNNLIFNPIIPSDDAHNIDPDSFLINYLNLNFPPCEYYFPIANQSNFPDVTNKFTYISYNINSVPLHFDDFVDQVLTPFPIKFDVIGLCETKLTDDIEGLFNILLIIKLPKITLGRVGASRCLYILNLNLM